MTRHATRQRSIFYKAYKINDELGQKLLSVGMGKDQLFKLHQIFSAMDQDNSGEINLREFFTYIDIKRTRYSERAFTVMDRDGSGEVDFIEFVLAVWNYCSFSKPSLIRYSFDIYDLDGSGEIERGEATRCVREIWGDDWEQNANAQKVMAKLDAVMQTNPNERLTIQMFQDFTQRHPILLFPAFQLQTEIQHHVLGERFWQKAAARRSKIDPRFLNWKTFNKMAKVSHQNSQKFLETIDDVVQASNRVEEKLQATLPRKRSSLHNVLAKEGSRTAKVFLDESTGDAYESGGTTTQVSAFTSPSSSSSSTKEQKQPSHALPATGSPSHRSTPQRKKSFIKKQNRSAKEADNLVVEDVSELTPAATRKSSLATRTDRQHPVRTIERARTMR